MKKIVAILVTVLITASVFSQSPLKISYQRVIRNSSDQLVTNRYVRMQISILQGSVDATPAYVETQIKRTNANGLASILIGEGVIVSGCFANIDWANGTYFIKTETDPTGGTSYTTSRTSQLLSVPYAFHARTAETFTITETDPVFKAWDKSTSISIRESQIRQFTSYLTSEVDSSVTNELQALTISHDTIYLSNGGFVKLPAAETTAETDPFFSAWDGDYAELINTPAVPDGSETKVTAGTNITITGDGTTASPYVVNEKTLTIGQSYQGGVIFWLDETGQHGLIAATTDQSTGIQWYNGTERYTGTETNVSDNGLYAGAMNTVMIVATQIADNQAGNFAAKVCTNYYVIDNGITFGDWYLPSKYELNLLYQQKDVVGGFDSTIYWSSNEVNNYNAWGIDFASGTRDFFYKSNERHVRAIRAF